MRLGIIGDGTERDHLGGLAGGDVEASATSTRKRSTV